MTEATSATTEVQSRELHVFAIFLGWPLLRTEHSHQLFFPRVHATSATEVTILGRPDLGHLAFTPAAGGGMVVTGPNLEALLAGIETQPQAWAIRFGRVRVKPGPRGDAAAAATAAAEAVAEGDVGGNDAASAAAAAAAEGGGSVGGNGRATGSPCVSSCGVEGGWEAAAFAYGALAGAVVGVLLLAPAVAGSGRAKSAVEWFSFRSPSSGLEQSQPVVRDSSSIMTLSAPSVTAAVGTPGPAAVVVEKHQSQSAGVHNMGGRGK